MLSGDIELNPGPVKFPCTICKNPVKKNQRGLCCDVCNLWTHARCCRVSNDQYDQLSLDCINDWLCPACVSEELPFANSSASCISEELSSAKESLTTDTFQLRSILTNAKRPAIFGISETWLESDVPDVEVAIPSYKLFRRDCKSRGGGVLVYVPERCKSKRRLDLEDDEIECVWVEVRLNKMTILLGNMYRPPNADLSVLSNFEAMMERVAAECRDVVLMGDLNINLLAQSSQSSRLLLITSENNLEQLTSEPTRITDHSQTPGCSLHLFS